MINAAILMDPISQINRKKDTSFAMLLEMQRRNYGTHYLEPQDIWLQDGMVWGKMHRIEVHDNATQWYSMGQTTVQPLADLDLLLMRKDPPVNMDYLYLTYLLEIAESQGLTVLNKPGSIRDANEKLFACHFPQCTPPHVVTAQREPIEEFLQRHPHSVIKPLNAMGGQGIFQLRREDPNLPALLDTATRGGTERVMVQQYLDDIALGDKRIIMIHGEALPYGIARIPAENDFRGNLAAGASAADHDLTDRDHWIAEQVGPELKARGLALVGLDIIGDYLTEINVTSPTCIREIDAFRGVNVLEKFFDVIESTWLT